jgi:hypothetical protein
MNINEKISFLYGHLHKSINTMDTLIDGMMQRHEADFISAYRVSITFNDLISLGPHVEGSAGVAIDKEVHHRAAIQDEVGQSSEHLVEVSQVVQGRGHEPEQDRREQEPSHQEDSERVLGHQERDRHSHSGT